MSGLPDRTAVALLEAVAKRDFGHWAGRGTSGSGVCFVLGLGRGFEVEARVGAGMGGNVGYTVRRNGKDWTFSHYSDVPTVGADGVTFAKMGCGFTAAFGDGLDVQGVLQEIAEREDPVETGYVSQGKAHEIRAYPPSRECYSVNGRPAGPRAEVPEAMRRAVMFQDLSGLMGTLSAGPLRFGFTVPDGADYCSRVRTDVECADGPFSFRMSGVLTYGLGCVAVRGLVTDVSISADLGTDADVVYLDGHPVPVWGDRRDTVGFGSAALS